RRGDVNAKLQAAILQSRPKRRFTNQKIYRRGAEAQRDARRRLRRSDRISSKRGQSCTDASARPSAPLRLRGLVKFSRAALDDKLRCELRILPERNGRRLVIERLGFPASLPPGFAFVALVGVERTWRRPLHPARYEGVLIES